MLGIGKEKCPFDLRVERIGFFGRPVIPGDMPVLTDDQFTSGEGRGQADGDGADVILAEGRASYQLARTLGRYEPMQSGIAKDNLLAMRLEKAFFTIHVDLAHHGAKGTCDVEPARNAGKDGPGGHDFGAEGDVRRLEVRLTVRHVQRVG